MRRWKGEFYKSDIITQFSCGLELLDDGRDQVTIVRARKQFHWCLPL
jgi:hypothetical protein